MDNFEFLDPNLPKNGFWGRNFKNLSLDLESASLRYYVHQFSDKMDNVIFRPKFGEIAQLRAYFGSNIVEGVAERWVKAEMSWVEVDGAGWR